MCYVPKSAQEEREVAARLYEENAVQQNMEEGGTAAPETGPEARSGPSSTAGQSGPGGSSGSGPGQLEMTGPRSNTIER
ncbi:hypothetical protein GPECTOR_3g354 [Gonium pectorale]|uniref:Uncharacterized protein n=1 Tax=Gonium pectorale TaxID=33097 RepID=A0A150GZE1_GONPE|nr:hypothetical protein GPECTOR_3g354 [Gonium pectorale]|eukprot:KXZ55211.1 hypothetical protein GPECTOR_3g354 [Gonium pectorale]